MGGQNSKYDCHTDVCFCVLFPWLSFYNVIQCRDFQIKKTNLFGSFCYRKIPKGLVGRLGERMQEIGRNSQNGGVKGREACLPQALALCSAVVAVSGVWDCK